MTEPSAPGSVSIRTPRAGPGAARTRLVAAAITLGILDLSLVVLIALSSVPLRTIGSTPSLWDDAASVSFTRAVKALAEEPHFAQVQGQGTNPICEDVAPRQAEALADGFNLMRQTAEGERLFDQLLAEHICVRTGTIEYNSGYAYVVQTITGSWSRSYIKIASRFVDGQEADVLAALLVHEATHVDRYVHGTACSFTETCTILSNGVELEEEVAAHRAEAEWWIAAYGENGKRFALGYDYGMNELVDAYRDGDAAFVAHVRELRSDERERHGS